MGIQVVRHPATTLRNLSKYPVTLLTFLVYKNQWTLACYAVLTLPAVSTTGSVGRRPLHREDVHILAPAVLWEFCEEANKSEVMVINCMTSSVQ